MIELYELLGVYCKSFAVIGTTALHDAAKYGKTAIAKKLIDKGADVHSKDRAGFTPLHVRHIVHEHELRHP